MWTTDSQCARCSNKKECPDRPEMLRTFTQLQNKLNVEEPFVSGKGDGIIIMSCNDFKME